MKPRSLLFLRVSLGLLMLIWGVDKLVNVQHGLAVSKHFYLGAFDSVVLLQAFGVAQMALGVLIVLGVARRVAYPLLLAITGATLLGVWKSVVDPWGWYLKGANVLFYPSLIIFAASLVLWAFRDDDHLAVGGRSRPGVSAG
jgi:putative oxidoreductase